MKEKIENTENEILGFEQWVENIQLPSGNIYIKKWITIIDAKKFVDSHLAIVKANINNPVFLPYLERLKEFKEYLENQSTMGKK